MRYHDWRKGLNRRPMRRLAATHRPARTCTSSPIRSMKRLGRAAASCSLENGPHNPRTLPPPGGMPPAGCIARLDVVHGIADEQRLVGFVTEALQRGQYGLRMWFVSRAGVTAHDRLEIAGDADELETASREHVALARDHRHWMACLLEGGQ